MKNEDHFDKAASAVYLTVGIPGPTLKKWSDKGLIPCRKDSNGRWLYSNESVKRAAEIRSARRTATA
jgi:predicted site-specific integrase-resolvase